MFTPGSLPSQLWFCRALFPVCCHTADAWVWTRFVNTQFVGNVGLMVRVLYDLSFSSTKSRVSFAGHLFFNPVFLTIGTFQIVEGYFLPHHE
jgi:hypothetical protein